MLIINNHIMSDKTQRAERGVHDDGAEGADGGVGVDGAPAPIDPSRTSDEATLFASPLPIVGNRKTTTRKELWVRRGIRLGYTPS
jgi:hypothetical protein